MLSAAQKGIELGSMIGKLPREAHENATASAMAAVGQEYAAGIQAQIKEIRGRKDLTPAQQREAILGTIRDYGVTFSGGQAGFDPYQAILKALDIQQKQTTLGGGVESQSVGGRQPVTPQTPQTPTGTGSQGSVTPQNTQNVQPKTSMNTSQIQQPQVGQLASATPMPATFLQNPAYQQSDFYPQPATFLA
jgi:hypothetical protein